MRHWPSPLRMILALLFIALCGCRAVLPMKDAVPARNTTALIDGVWVVDAIDKRIRIEQGRGYALDSWFHLMALKVEPDMVVLKDLSVSDAGLVTGQDLPLLGPLEGQLQPRGKIAVKVKGSLGPVSYNLVPVELRNPAALAELIAAEVVATAGDSLPEGRESPYMKPLAPIPLTNEAKKPLPINDEVRETSRKIIKTRDLTVAKAIAERLETKLRGKKGLKPKVETIRQFRLTSSEEQEVRQQGFRTVTIEVGGGGNSPYLIGGSVSQGVALGIPPNRGVRAITSGGLSVGVPGGAGEARVGFWKAKIDELDGWSMGVNTSAVTPKFVGIGAGVFWSLAVPPKYEGFNVGVTFSPAGVGGDAGLGWTQYTGKIKDFFSDTGRVLTLKPTEHGKPLGGSCKVGTDCLGYIVPIGSKRAGVSCCKKSCTQMKKNYMGVSMCPHLCRRTAISKFGTCS